MANPDRGQVDLQIGAKTYLLTFDNNAIRILESHLGRGIAYVLQHFDEVAGIDFVCKAVHAGLQYEDSPHKKLSISRIAAMLPPDKFEDAIGVVVKGLLSWRGVDVKEDDAEATKEAPAENPT